MITKVSSIIYKGIPWLQKCSVLINKILIIYNKKCKSAHRVSGAKYVSETVTLKSKRDSPSSKSTH